MFQSIAAPSCTYLAHLSVYLLLASVEIHAVYSKGWTRLDYGLKCQPSISWVHRRIRRLPVSGWFSTLPHDMPSLWLLVHFVFVAPPLRLCELLIVHAIWGVELKRWKRMEFWSIQEQTNTHHFADFVLFVLCCEIVSIVHLQFIWWINNPHAILLCRLKYYQLKNDVATIQTKIYWVRLQLAELSMSIRCVTLRYVALHYGISPLEQANSLRTANSFHSFEFAIKCRLHELPP